MDRVSMFFERICGKEMLHIIKRNISHYRTAKNLGISLSPSICVSCMISVCKKQGQNPELHSQALRWHCNKNRQDTYMEVAAWAEKHFFI